MQNKYDHKEVEANKNENWIKDKIFQDSKLKNSSKNFSIILPPPNVTGKLHLGHAWDGALQDILIRYKKMNGYNTTWICGMDHAGIATQAKVEGKLREEGLNKKDIGREKFLEKSWEWKNKYSQRIEKQWGKLGLGLDYSNQKFTLDDDINKQVKNVFVKLHEEGLIYQGTRIINWDPKAETAISDIEVEHKEVEGNFYYLKYFLKDSDEFLEVATTRPETIFGDQALAINPLDNRSAKLENQKVIIPGTNIEIPIVLDEYVDQDFGTGIVKITPAHDPNDYEVGKRHDLKQLIVMNLDGTMNQHAFEYEKLDRFECRKNLIQNLEKNNLVTKIEPHIHNVGHSERTGVVVEPLLSKQWFLKADTLAKEALQFQTENKEIEFYPNRFKNTYMTWMDNLHDWCISRQLWWGHQIPVWYHKETGEMHVSENGPKDPENYNQDPDVLDTWFSSALWPFTTQTLDMKKLFYPTSVLVTGYDIIFFWVSRMIFQGIKFEKNIPFEKVLIHGLVRDENGKKMSKSLGNGIDPMDVIEKYGSDALRYFLTTNSTPGQDLRYSEQKIESSWNYINKLWNISKFVFLNTEDIKNKFTPEYDYNKEIENFTELSLADKYIIKRMNETIKYVKTMMEKFEFTEVSSKIYNFVISDFASWYVEVSKTILNLGTQKEQEQTKHILLATLLNVLKMLHPFIPFVTEEIYEEINKNNNYLVTTKYPQIIKGNFENNFTDIQEIITALRNFKTENDIKPSQEVEINLKRINEKYIGKLETNILLNFGKIRQINYETETNSDEEIVIKVLENITMEIKMAGLIDHEAKKEQLIKQKEKVEGELFRSSNILKNDKFIKNATEEKIKIEKDKAQKYVEQYLEILNNDQYDLEQKFSTDEIKKMKINEEK